MTRNELYNLDSYTQATHGLPRTSGSCPACGEQPIKHTETLCPACDLKRQPTREVVPGEPGFLLKARRTPGASS